MPTEIASLYASVGADTSGLKKGLDSAGRMLGTTEQQMRKIDGTSRQADKGMAGLGGTFGKVAMLLGGMKLGQMAVELGTLGAEAQRTEASFTGVAGGAEKATAMLDALKVATNGTKSEVELMSGATTIMALGLGKTADEIGTIMRNVEGLGARFGGNMQTFQLMMSNDSLMRIDSFGIGVEEATKRIEEYKKAGMDAGEAFDTAVMDLMTEKFESLGGTMDDNKASIDRMKASLQDLKVEIGQGLAPTIGTLATNMGDLLRLTNRAGKEYGSMGWQIADMLVEAVDFADWIHTSIDDMEELESAERGYRAETARLTGQAEEYIAKVREQAEVTLRHQIAMRSTNGVVVESLDVWKQYERAQAQSSEAMQRYPEELRKIAKEAEAAAAAVDLISWGTNQTFSADIEAGAENIGELRDKAGELQAKIAELEGLRYRTSAQETELAGLREDLGSVNDSIQGIIDSTDKMVKTFILGMVEMQIAADKDITPVESDFYVRLAAKFGLVDDAAIEMRSTVLDVLADVTAGTLTPAEGIKALGDAAIEAQTPLTELGTEGGVALDALGLAADGAADSLDKAARDAGALQSAIDALHGKDIIIRTYLEEHRAVGHASPVPYERNASGGWVNAGSASLVGERGPEMIYPTSAGVSVVPLSGAGADGGTRLGSTWTGDVVIQGVSDPEAAANAVIRKLADRGLIRAEGYR